MSSEQESDHTKQSDERQRKKKEASRQRFRDKARKKDDSAQLAGPLINGNRKALSKAITLVESKKADDHKAARTILERCLPQTGDSMRIGITGIPGVGKSTFIDRLGRYALENNHKLAVLTVDPSSSQSGGSILGDKTRMSELSKLDNVYIRPSPTSGTLGGVARKTRETMLLCEAAGYDRIFIETVGVGQSETAVRSMVDCFLLLVLPGSGDELQGIKRGIVEMADVIAINKAENPESKPIRNAISTYKSALKMLPDSRSGWEPPVLTCSALENQQIDEVWQAIQSFMSHIQSSGFMDQQRHEQLRHWMYETIDQQLRDHFYDDGEIKKLLPQAEKNVVSGQKTAFQAAQELLKLYFDRS